MNKQELIGYAEQKVAYYESKARFFPEVREYAEGAISGIALLISEIKKLDEPQKVKVKHFVADWFEEHKHDLSNSLWEFTVELNEKTKVMGALSEFESWFIEHPRAYEFITSMGKGYEVEEEPRYKVIMPNPQSKNGNLLVLRRNQRGTITVNKVKANTARSGEGMDLTEKEIKSVDERYWPFAVPVEKV
ncbi:DUF1642 domain-containing protein [Enterococcus avium]|uniref:DUF1642 domain-containing protein n=1 Tax=Enterococcus avium TaxID=33945 RepID=UPI001F584871|nr:DUF1642 domain-containing protein [Enterococcus avium]